MLAKFSQHVDRIEISATKGEQLRVEAFVCGVKSDQYLTDNLIKFPTNRKWALDTSKLCSQPSAEVKVGTDSIVGFNPDSIFDRLERKDKVIEHLQNELMSLQANQVPLRGSLPVSETTLADYNALGSWIIDDPLPTL